MELSKEFIESNKLDENQVKAVSEFAKTYTDGLIADTKKEYDGKASTDADKILDGAATSIGEKFGITRDQGEKIADFVSRVSAKASEGLKTDLDKAKQEYADKIKDFKGDDATKEELQKAKDELDEAKKKLADFDKYKETAEKYETLSESNSKLKLEVSFGQVKPVFPDNVNPFEADVKWKEFKSNILKDNTIELVDGEPMVISNENQYKQEKLKDLVAKDPVISALLQGRKQEGPGGKQTELQKIEGVPFDVPKGADGKATATLIRDYLAKEGIDKMSPAYATKFAELNRKIKQETA
jgi:hypothetical protein